MRHWKTSLNDAATSVESGKRIEDRVADFLAQQAGLRVLHRNYRTKGGELDFIVEENLGSPEKPLIDLVILEVRARGSEGWVNGLESVTSTKRRRIEHATRCFLIEYRGAAQAVRFDVISADERDLRWFRGAW